MRVAALVVSLLGGLAGSVVSLVNVSLLVVLGLALDTSILPAAVALNVAALGFCVLAMAGGIAALSRPGLGALLLLVSSAGVAVAMLLELPDIERTISAFHLSIFVAPLLLVAAGLAFAGRYTFPEREAG